MCVYVCVWGGQSPSPWLRFPKNLEGAGPWRRRGRGFSGESRSTLGQFVFILFYVAVGIVWCFFFFFLDPGSRAHSGPGQKLSMPLTMTTLTGCLVIEPPPLEFRDNPPNPVFDFRSVQNGTQDFLYASQALYQLSYDPNSYLFHGVSRSPGWPQNFLCS